MKLMRNILIALATAAFIVGSAAAQEYTVTDLGKVATSSVAHAMNSSGQIVGAIGGAHGDNLIAFFWPNHGGKPIGRPQHSDYSEAFGINDAGQVVGAANLQDGMRGFTWSNGNNLTLLNPLAGDSSSAAYALNNAGTAAGFSSGPHGTEAVIWRNDLPQTLVANSTNATSEALAINANGSVVGFLGEGSQQRGFIWSTNGLHELLPIPGDDSSQALAVNQSEQAAGISMSNGLSRATLWDQNGVHNLGILQSGNHSEAFGINNAQFVVGSSGSSLGRHAFLWTPQNGMQDLNNLIPPNSDVVLSAAVAINDAGQIVAVGNLGAGTNPKQEMALDRDNHAGVTRVFLLTPMPQSAAVRSKNKTVAILKRGPR
jgi:probable HAF family extracellular repeat protein